MSSGSGFVERCTLTITAHGPLAGVRLAVKDNIEVEGRRYTSGHPLFAARRAIRTAVAARRLLEAGATLVGMTATDAGGFGVTTPGVLNPLDPDAIVGGSSGGAAAVVAAGYADLALGTDTGGSVRIPAACTGLFAYKPDRDAVSTEGVWPLAASFDHVGLIANSRALLLQAARAMLGASTRNTAPEPTAIRVGVESNPDSGRDPQVAALMEAVAGTLGAAGYRLVSVALPERDRIVDAHSTLTLFEARNVYRDLSDGDREQLGAAAISALKVAQRLSGLQIEQARRSVAAIRAAFAEAFSRVDVLILPTLSFPPPRIDARLIASGRGDIPLFRALTYDTCGFNIYGGPAYTFPSERVAAGSRIPLSLQAAVSRCSDSQHLALLDAISSDLSRGLAG